MRRIIPLASRYGALAIQFAVVAVVTQELNKSDAGLYLALNGVVQSTFFVAGFGTPDGLVRTVSELRGHGKVSEAGQLLSRGTAASLWSLAPSGIAVGIVASIISGDALAGVWLTLWWAAYGLMFVIAQALVAAGRGELGTFAFYTLINVGLAIVLVPASLLGAVHSATEAMFFTVVGSLASLAGFAPVFLRVMGQAGAGVGPSPSPRLSIVETRKLGVAIAANRVLQAASIWSPVWIVSVVHGSAWAAIVAVGSRLVGVVGAGLAAINFSIRPRLVDLGVGGSRSGIPALLRRVSTFALALVGVSVLGNLLVGERLITLFFGAGYGKATWVLTVLLVGAAGDAFAGASAEVVKMLGSARWLLRTQALFLVGGAALQFLVGTWAGVWAQLAVFVLVTLALNVVVRRAARSILDDASYSKVLQ